MASRPLYNPNPSTFVGRDVVKDKELRRVRVSDFVVVALQIHIDNNIITKAAVDIFETVYVRGAKPRLTRVHEGEPALAPDGTVLSMNNVPYPGSSGLAAGPWTTANVKDCDGYDAWLKRILQTEEQMVAAGNNANEKNMPRPEDDDLATANAYQPPPMKRAEKSAAQGSKKEKGKAVAPYTWTVDVHGLSPDQIANQLIDVAAGGINQFLYHIKRNITDGDVQKSLVLDMYSRVGALIREPVRAAKRGRDDIFEEGERTTEEEADSSDPTENGKDGHHDTDSGSRARAGKKRKAGSKTPSGGGQSSTSTSRTASTQKKKTTLKFKSLAGGSASQGSAASQGALADDV